MSAVVSSIIRIACRNRSACQQAQTCRAIIRRALARGNAGRQRQVTTTAKKAAAVATATITNDEEALWKCTAAALLLASGIAVLQSNNNVNTTTQAEPRRVPSLNSARSSNLNRFRSITDRGMNSKYIVDWKVVLGEGAYGSVHPARLAATGEKVSGLFVWQRECIGVIFVVVHLMLLDWHFAKGRLETYIPSFYQYSRFQSRNTSIITHL